MKLAPPVAKPLPTPKGKPTPSTRSKAVLDTRPVEIGDAHDSLEHEADAVADRVLQMPSTGTAGDSPAARFEGATLVLRRACCSSCASEEDELRREPAAGQRGGFASESFTQRVQSRMQIGGAPLGDEARAFLEPRLGVGLDDVRMHTDGDAGELARAVHARAFTLGRHIFFGQGQHRPRERDGMHLLAHEVAHTLQSVNNPSTIRRAPLDEVDATNVEMVLVDYDAGIVQFLTAIGPINYELKAGEQVPPGTYHATVELSNSMPKVNLRLSDLEPGEDFEFGYSIAEGQVDPSDLFRAGNYTQHTVEVTILGEEFTTVFEVHVLDPEQLTALAGISIDELSESTFFQAPISDSEGVGLGLSDLSHSALGSSMGVHIADWLVPVVPNDSVGASWQGSHQSLFASIDGVITREGFRAPYWKHALSEIPGLKSMHMSDLTLGYPGGWVNDWMFGPMNPFVTSEGTTFLYRETSRAKAAAFRSDIPGTTPNNLYALSPLHPDASEYENFVQRVGPDRAQTCKANNCLTVPADILEREVLRDRMMVDMTLDDHRNIWKLPKNGLEARPKVQATVHIPTGMVYVPGQAPVHEPSLEGRGAAAKAFYGPENEARLAQAGVHRINIPRRVAWLRTAARGGNLALGIFGVYMVAKRLNAASEEGLTEVTGVALEESAGWAAGALGGALGGAAGGAVACAWAGPGTLLCAAGGFVGGLVVGSVSSELVMDFVAGKYERGVEDIKQTAASGIEMAAALGKVAPSVAMGLESILLYERPIACLATLETSNWEFTSDVHDASIIETMTALGSGLQEHFFDRLETVGIRGVLEDLDKPVESLGVALDTLGSVVAYINAEWTPEHPLDSDAMRSSSAEKLITALLYTMAADFVYDPELLAMDAVEMLSQSGEFPTTPEDFLGIIASHA